ncbi:uncharacterized protein LOC117781081 [Drosophila innubila]|uniref:uncharacterized protein LOC117781081 n=1 Tax=Drosophila innubila TaxID=198719 RepID=UPI00148BC4B1|nr:uncharacterized protein LOC117781081 [Drosophila innubila]
MLLTREECVKILRNFLKSQSDQLKLRHYNLERDTSAIGYLGDYYALTLCYCTTDVKNAQQAKLFVKALPQQSDEPAKERIFQKESWLYETLLAKMQQYSKIKWSANCYYTRSDLCVLENIKHIGYQSAPAKQLKEEELFQLLRTLSAFHASSLIYEQQQKINIGVEFGERLPEITVAADIAWFTTGLSAILAVIRSLPQYQTSRHHDFINSHLTEILQRIYEQVLPSTKYQNVLCHRDLWSGNIFFPSNQKDAVLLVDFQTCRYTPPAIDLVFSLYLNLSVEERRRLEAKCIDFYYNWLRQDLQDFDLMLDELISNTELLQSYEEFRLFGVVYSAVAATIIKVPPSYVTNDFKYVDRSKIILNYMRENVDFREAMELCCVEVMEIAMLTL